MFKIGEITSSIKSLKNLQHLQLDYNQLKGMLFDVGIMIIVKNVDDGD